MNPQILAQLGVKAISEIGPVTISKVFDMYINKEQMKRDVFVGVMKEGLIPTTTYVQGLNTFAKESKESLGSANAIMKEGIKTLQLMIPHANSETERTKIVNTIIEITDKVKVMHNKQQNSLRWFVSIAGNTVLVITGAAITVATKGKQTGFFTASTNKFLKLIK